MKSFTRLLKSPVFTSSVLITGFILLIYLFIIFPTRTKGLIVEQTSLININSTLSILIFASLTVFLFIKKSDLSNAEINKENALLLLAIAIIMGLFSVIIFTFMSFLKPSLYTYIVSYLLVQISMFAIAMTTLVFSSISIIAILILFCKD